ncbi:unnamed protein product [Caenorhabditis angaria]|uniref:DUF38 domain-containing protein n=1 Tax=Caenorhabditis angaria TaxID=860376 RepID=A0A9P1MYH8_9PELO|nr:unnamed protein product [Caenorhabditis angaria]
MKFLVPLFLTIIAFSNCEDLQVLVKNFEAKIRSLIDAKNFDGLAKYIHEHPKFWIAKIAPRDKQEIIDCLKNGTFILFNGVGPSDIPKIGFEEPSQTDSRIGVFRNMTDGREVDYKLRKQNGTEFGYLIHDYIDYKA